MRETHKKYWNEIQALHKEPRKMKQIFERMKDQKMIENWRQYTF